MQNNKSFTLIELLVVVAIIGLLAAMTLPTYAMNTTKARIATIVPLLDKMMHDLLVEYASNGSTPSTLDGVSGVGSSGGYGSFVNPNMTTNLHYINGGGVWQNNGAMIAVTIPTVIGQGIPGFVESTNGSDGTYNSIAMAFYDEQGTIILYCGRWDSSNNIYIPIQFLPPGCNNDNFMSTVTGL